MQSGLTASGREKPGAVLDSFDVFEVRRGGKLQRLNPADFLFTKFLGRISTSPFVVRSFKKSFHINYIYM